MKKRYVVLMIVLVLVVSATTLSFALSPSADALIDKVNDTVKKAELSAEEAENVALADAKLARDDVFLKRSEADRERGRLVWEVEFYHNGVEYEYDIDANTGEVVKRKTEKEDRPSVSPDPAPTPDPVPNPDPAPNPDPKPEPPVADELSADDALAVALADAGLSKDSVSRVRVEKDRDDGVWVYEVEFEKGRTEYEYEIRVSDGKILERDIDND